MDRVNGPNQIGDALDVSLACLRDDIAERHRKRVEAAVRPSESFAQAESHLRVEDAAKEQAQSAAIVAGQQREDAAKVGLPMRRSPEEDERVELWSVLIIVLVFSVSYHMMVNMGTSYADDVAPMLERRTIYLIIAGGATLVMLAFAVALLLMLKRQRTVEHALRASEALFRATFHQAAMGIAHIAPDGRIFGVNEKFCRMLGYSSDELRQRTLFELSDPERREAAQQFLAQRLSASAAESSHEMEKIYRCKNGAALWVCETLGVVTDTQGQPEFLVAVTQDITARKELEARLSHAALHDALTGLPNRVMFRDRLSQVLAFARRHSRYAAVLYIDLDGFKATNDSHGHAQGDSLLQQVAYRLQNCVRAEDTVSRFWGDEFGILLATVRQPHDGETVALKILEVLVAPFNLQGDAVHISASIGVAIYPQHGDDTDTLIAYADHAMYAAKRLGKNQFC